MINNLELQIIVYCFLLLLTLLLQQRDISNFDETSISFCDAIKYETKYKVEVASSFEKEIIEYRKLVRMI